jgi:Protein of unknown function (DUF3667)
MSHIQPDVPRDYQRITFTAMVLEVIHTLTHVENDFLYTLKKLLSRPGFMIRDYILGKRSHYQKPFAMLFISIAVFSFTMWVFFELKGKGLSADSGWDDVYQYNFEYVVLYKYFSWIQLALVPVYGFILKLFNWKSYYNYGELIVLYCFLFAAILLLLIPVIILQQFIPVLRLPYIEVIISVAYTLWVCINFFKPTGQSTISIIVKTVAGTLISYVIMILTYNGIARLLTWWHFH